MRNDPHYLAFEASYQYFKWRNTKGSFWLYRACAEMWAVVGRRKLDRPRPHSAAGGRAILMETTRWNDE